MFARGRRRLPVLAALTLTLAGSVALSGNTYASQPVGAKTIYPATAVPAQTESGDRNAVELGARFTVHESGAVVAIRFYKASTNPGPHTGTLWTGDGHRMSRGVFRSESASGWQTMMLPRHVHVVPGKVYVASYNAPNGNYSQTQREFAGGRTVGNSSITALAGVYAYGHGSYPHTSWNNSGYGVDVDFMPGDPGSPTPAPSSSSPAPTSSAPAPPSSTSPAPHPSSTGASPTPTRTTSSSSSPTSAAPTSTTPVPDPTSSGMPPRSEFPDASDTGVPAGTTLRDVPGDVSSGPGWHWDSRGWVVIDGNGAVFSGFREFGGVDVRAANVTVSKNDISNDGEGDAVLLRSPARDVTISDNTMHGPCLLCTNRLTYGINGGAGGDAGVKILRNKLYWIDHPLQVDRGLVQDNYTYLLASNGTTDHVDAFFSGGGTMDQLTIRHNSLLNDYTDDGTTASIILSNAFGVQSNRLIENNLIGGGGYTLYGGAGNASGTNVVIRDNYFTTKYSANSGYYGPVTAILSGSTNLFTNNRWYDGPRAGRLIEP